ncbi:energy transducer TonB [Sphingobium sp.]|uniref:energy transducer TonB n=1 Tax=Sphingobium sp. TaxID=1912891 RepID=UPI003B3A5861
MARNPAIEIFMVSQRIRECIIALGAAAIVAVAVHLWQRQYAVDIPVSPPARRIDSGASAPPLRPGNGGTVAAAADRAAPASSPGGWFSDLDYPAEATRNGWEGTTGFRLSIDSAGRVVRCDVTQSSGHAVLDEATCRMLTRNARFRPARAATGMPVPDIYNGRVSWRMPD